MSAKPKVYQGVKVRMTVKEMLEQRRALQAEKTASESRQNKMQVAHPIPPPLSSEMISAREPTSCVPTYQENRQPSVCGALEESLMDAYLHPEPLTDSSFTIFQNQSLCFQEETFQPSPIFYQNMTPESPSDSSDMSNSFEYSPSYQGLEFVTQNYSSPSPQDNNSCAYADMDYPVYQHQNNSTCCYCAYCCSMDYQQPLNTQDSCAYTNTDYMGYHTPSEDFLTRELNIYNMYS
ncbi:POU class 2 homeobox associating factor 3 isoform X2 [Hyla sarda]|uniref:POU class 2 homeobox associating factor 3 isoform X2 n=1 Tax=Hyla sarda TaxID=327740 RepID=UPI0024C397F1|nr:POU class 2 homeobox associating factor 3 isoform X2 [Hyla sarda]XP_056399319.1 POU class 2 homeobox associating factor 3 isoform X2 [Hyla sarda]